MLALFLSMIEGEEQRSKFEKIYNTYDRSLFKIALSITRDIHHAEDALQESYLIVVKIIEDIDFSEEKMVKALLYKIVKNKAIDTLRKKNLDRRMILPLLDDYEDSVNVEEQIATDELNEKLNYAISSLPQIYRDILALRYVYGFKLSRISDILQVNLSTAKTRLTRGKQMLKEKLTEEKVYERI